ncbi:MAG: (2Fe-2S)-binding protein [Pseudorhodoplanes sp.]|uniref:(2Fe-2S)-binding protein n=1 Tax=Pseudorhodoplanes sp. TaxID=1934341 RepID=UPI003D0DD923
MAKAAIRLRVNGEFREGEAEPRVTAGDFLRNVLRYTGTHLGCEHGVCGACTIHVDGVALRSCLLFAVQLDGCDVRTVEGLADGDRLNALQQAFSDAHALQCGFCTPGMLMTVTAFLEENPSPTEEEVREAIASNLCRCTGYVSIVEAVMKAARNISAAGKVASDAGTRR